MCNYNGDCQWIRHRSISEQEDKDYSGVLLFALTLIVCIREGVIVIESDEQTDPKSSADVSPAFDTSDIENNGGAYIRVGNRINFQRYGPDSLDSVALFGSFIENWDENGSESSILYLDLDDGTIKEAFSANCYGCINFAKDYFYLQERIDGTDYVVRRSLDGREREVIQEGTLLGVTNSGLVAVGQTDDSSPDSIVHRFDLHLGTKELRSYESDGSMYYAGLSDEGLFLLKRKSWKSQTEVTK